MSKVKGKPVASADKGRADKHSKPRRRTPGRGTLWIIALLLLSSGIVRLGGETGQAIARDLAQTAMPGEGDGPEHAANEACTPPEDIAVVLARLSERETMLDAREDALADRVQALKVAEARINDNLARLVAAEAKLEATMVRAESAAEDDLTRLTAVYENMKPKEAAPLFEAMDPQFAAGFLARMRPDAAAKIMSGLKPETAYTISVVLAGRNANAPTN